MTKSGTNMFAQFAAGKSKTAAASTGRSSGSSGWFTTKKRGRDDAQIQRDKQKAMDARKARLSKGRNASKAKSISTHSDSKSRAKRGSRKLTAKSKGRQYDDESDDSFVADDESDIEFVESEEEEDFLEESEEDSDDEIVLEEDDESNDHDSIEEIESSPEKKRKVTKRPAVVKPRSRQASRIPRKKPGVITFDSSSSDEDDEHDSDINEPPKSTKFTAKEKSRLATKKKILITDLDDSSDDDEELLRPIEKTKPKQNLKTNPTTKAKAKPKLQSVKEAGATSRFFQARGGKKESSLTSPTIFTKKRPKKREQFLDSSDDEKSPTTTKSSKILIEPSSTSGNGDLGLSDTDDEAMMEALALSKAIAESKKEEEARQKAALVKHDKSKSGKTIYKEDPKSEEEDGDDGEDLEEVEEYRVVDEKELEASYVLNAANNLSARIMSTMNRWFGAGDDSNDGLQGMIIDGAIAISASKVKGQDSEGSFAEEKKEDIINRGDEKLISDEVMKRVCPNITLKDYQLLGVNWMALLHSETFEMNGSKEGKKKRKKGGNGRNVNGVLADEMGLGKTAQTIAFLAWLKYRNTDGPPVDQGGVIDVDDDSDDDNYEDEGEDNDYHRPHIIIVPASVLENWQREFKKFCPTMNVVKYHGSMAERQQIKSELRQYLPKKAGPSRMRYSKKKLDVVLTTFSYFSTEKSDDRSFLRKFDWNYMVVDEAHCLKNPRGQRYKNMDAFSTDRRLLLTGTPIQNSPKELMSLLCFLMPLFSREASTFDEDDKNDGGARMLEYFVRLEATDKRATTTVSKEEAYRKLKLLLAPFVLRRRKDDVLGQWLPPKERKVEWVPFEKSTRFLYDSIVKKHLQAKKDGSVDSSMHVFTSLRKAANHALLLRTRHTSPGAIDHLATKLYTFGYFGHDATCNVSLVKKELEKFSDYDIHCAAAALIEENTHRSGELERYLLQEESLYCSPKFVRLKELLPKLIKEGHRILIFSQWTRVLDLLGCFLETLDLSFLRLDGQTDISERQSLIDRFTNDTSIPLFLLSTRAGGMGINLTAADTCILHDLDFNPFNDIQAEDRVHRIGQKRPVTVIKMITKETVDADIYSMQERKAEMNAAILETKQSSSAAKKKEKEDMNVIFEMAVSRYNASSVNEKED